MCFKILDPEYSSKPIFVHPELVYWDDDVLFLETSDLRYQFTCSSVQFHSICTCCDFGVLDLTFLGPAFPD